MKATRLVPRAPFAIIALHGDNIVDEGSSMRWYDGPSLLHQLEQAHIASDRNLIDARFPVQYVIHRRDFRGYAGTIAGGVLRPGDDVTVLPSGFTSTITHIYEPGGTDLAEAFPPHAVVLRLADELDVARGDLICRPGNQPHTGQDIDAMICWLTEHSTLSPGNRYTLQHTTRRTKTHIRELDYRLDINTLHRQEDATTLALNEIGRISLRTQQPLLFDPYRSNRTTGSFILIDEATRNTVAAGMITKARHHIGPSLRVGHSRMVSRLSSNSV